MRLSEAIRLGAMLHPQGFGAFIDNLPGPIDKSQIRATCALGAAWVASGAGSRVKVATEPIVTVRGVAPVGTMVSVLDVPPEWQSLLRAAATCPAADCVRYGSLNDAIQHLNDGHRWTREAIAEWVALIEPADESPAPVDAVAGTVA